jgi:hypothetical protein
MFPKVLIIAVAAIAAALGATAMAHADTASDGGTGPATVPSIPVPREVRELSITTRLANTTPSRAASVTATCYSSGTGNAYGTRNDHSHRGRRSGGLTNAGGLLNGGGL